MSSRYNYPLCEECNCDPEGVPPTFFAQGGCANVAPGTLCTCKERVTGRICDTCKPLFWNLDGNNPLGCSGNKIDQKLLFQVIFHWTIFFASKLSSTQLWSAIF